MLKKMIIDPLIRCKHSELLEVPTIVRVKKFDEDGSKDFIEQMEKALNSGQTFIPIVVDSFGGQVYTLMEMINKMETCGLPCYTICESKAMSCGAMLFSMGHKRYMSPNATLMLHDASLFTYGKAEEVKADARELERLNQLVFKMIAKNCQQKENYFLDLIHEKGHADWYLNTKDAKKHNLCTNVGIPNLNIKVSVDFYLE